MKPERKVVFMVIVFVAAATFYGVIRTGGSANGPAVDGKASGTGPEQTAKVDRSALDTAQNLAHLPLSASELTFAQQSLQLADQEMDLSFALAVLDVTQHPPVLSADAKMIQAQLQTAEDALAAQEAQVAQLTADEAKVTGAKKDALDDRLDLAKAELELRQDEVDDSEQDLIRAGGDPKGPIAAMVQEHQSASEASDATKVAATAAAEPRGLIQRFQQWSALHQKQLQLWRARQEALSASAAFTTRHNSLDGETEPQKVKAPTAETLPDASAPAAAPAAGESPASLSREASAAIVATTKQRAVDTKTASILDKRISNENQLANLYSQWIGVVAAGARANHKSVAARLSVSSGPGVSRDSAQ